MKIAFRLSKMSFGGTERVFLSVAEGLSKLYGVDIDFVVDSVGQGETEHLVVEKGFKLVGLSSKRTLNTIFPLKKYLETERPDILISAFTDTNFAAVVSAMLAQHACKLILSEHAPLKKHWQHFSRRRKFLLNAYVRYGYRFADHLLGVSKGLMDELIDFGHSPRKVSYIYNPVRFSSSNLNQPQSLKNATPTIIAVGRITPQKDYMTLLKAFDLLTKQTDAKLMIVGGVFHDAEKLKLDQFIKLHHLAEKVEFIGFTENVAAYYKKADIFVLSSAWEGFGNVLVEAMAFGLPIVSTNCQCGPAEILNNGEFGALVNVGDWQALATSMASVLKDKPTINRSILQKRAMEFSEENITKQYWAFFQKILTK